MVDLGERLLIPSWNRYIGYIQKEADDVIDVVRRSKRKYIQELLTEVRIQI